ncbi:hypothetical protein HTVC023P_gp78 [Pelagibacter phage HTVC023P]|nr:hypothetical protein HTVC023P_gp78 [Pelagibacter phage HTVC023P]
MPSDKYINKDTYQTLEDVKILPQSDFEKATTPLWKKDSDKKIEKSPYEIFVGTPVHSDVTIHYTQALIEFQGECFKRKTKVSFHMMKSSLVTQGRNLCVAGFLESPATHLLFIDSDIYFQAKTIFKMLEADKDIISVPYPLKTLMWDKAFDKMKQGKIKSGNDIRRALHTYPMKVPDDKNIKIDAGVIEVTDAPTGCMLIKRSVIEKMIEKYPEKKIVQKTVINGEYVDKPNMWNFFDTTHDPVEKTFLGEDFSFCQLWSKLGGKCYAYVNDSIVHVGEHQYQGRFYDELILSK